MATLNIIYDDGSAIPKAELNALLEKIGGRVSLSSLDNLIEDEAKFRAENIDEYSGLEDYVEALSEDEIDAAMYNACSRVFEDNDYLWGTISEFIAEAFCEEADAILEQKRSPSV